MDSGTTLRYGDRKDGWRAQEIKREVRNGYGCLEVAVEGVLVSG